MEQQTAVDWLYKELTNYISYDDDKAFKQHEDVTDIVNQAKEMEKKQIEEAIDNVLISYGIIKLKSNGTRYL